VEIETMNMVIGNTEAETVLSTMPWRFPF